MKLNDRLQRVQINRSKDVPIGQNSKLWYLWFKTDGTWDADSSMPKEELKTATQIFCVWHGEHRTNLFLMDNKIFSDDTTTKED